MLNIFFLPVLWFKRSLTPKQRYGKKKKNEEEKEDKLALSLSSLCSDYEQLMEISLAGLMGFASFVLALSSNAASVLVGCISLIFLLAYTILTRGKFRSRKIR